MGASASVDGEVESSWKSARSKELDKLGGQTIFPLLSSADFTSSGDCRLQQARCEARSIHEHATAVAGGEQISGLIGL